MTSAVTSSGPPPPATSAQPSQPPPMSPPQQPANPASPPSKRDLKSWWKRFQNQGKSQPTQEIRPQGIFGVPLRQSITYANVAISLIDENGKSYIYGYVPIVVAKCGVFLKEKATGIEGIFRLSGSEKRIKELKVQFDSPDRYGKGLVWDGYTVHDAANVLRRYLNDLPEPVVPLDLYESFRDPLRGHTKQAVGDAEGTQLVENFDEAAAIIKYQQLIKDLPALNRQLLLYILDLLAVFAAKADENRMTAQNLAAIFQPGMLSHPAHAMAPEEYRLNQCVIIFLIENQDHFLIGMQGTATDEKTKQEIEQGTPAIVTPATPGRSSGVNRSASNGSAAAESISKDGKVRRNRSTSSRHSRHSNGTSTPNSPAHMGTPSSGLGRSNTVPSKKSPHIPGNRFNRQDSPSVAVAPASPSPSNSNVATPPTVAEESIATERSPAASTTTPMTSSGNLMPGPHVVGRSQERLLESNTDSPVGTPSKEKGLPNLFQRSAASPDDKRQPNKLRKKRIPSSTNPSAQSSTTSLHQSGPTSPNLESHPTMESRPILEASVPEHAPATETPSEPTPRASQVPSTTTTAQPESENLNLKPKSSQPASLHSSYNDGSDGDQVPDDLTPSATTETPEKDKKRRWRISRRKDDGSMQNLGAHSYAEASSSTIGSTSKPRKSFTGESGDVMATLAESDTGGKDESKGPIGWIKNKYREAKENAEHKRAKSPPESSHGFLPTRGKSIDISRNADEKQASVDVHQDTPTTPAQHAQPLESVQQSGNSSEQAAEQNVVAPGQKETTIEAAPSEDVQMPDAPPTEAPQTTQEPKSKGS